MLTIISSNLTRSRLLLSRKGNGGALSVMMLGFGVVIVGGM
jgi:hypothetical protein